MWSRIHLIPVLQAEEDRDLVRRHWAQEAREKELLGAETKVYNNDRCVHPKRDRDGAVEESYGWRKLTKESGSCVLRTRSLPARPRNRGWWVRKQGRERDRGRKSEDMSCCKYCGYSGALFNTSATTGRCTVSNVHSNVRLLGMPLKIGLMSSAI
jgi:hypothetical protein